ncbi:30S ribosomal protein S9 [Candidatus Parcubacteria bacterium]|nr:30S ribosomal protein S9 [Patescibacteria group bacterium]MBU4481999.1 30S ribosomal protein S9 [Patescibacteria group bacterium]MCG2686736.1 30S ribosomal protein S9 [Candidatus Parcubacteria bacterium]
MPSKNIKENKKIVSKTVKKADKFIRSVGRRKSSAARVRLYPKGKGKIEINSRELKEYFPHALLNQKVTAPLVAVGKEKDFDFTIKVVGGGSMGQADACAHGIARALLKFNQEDYKIILRKAGFLTRDPREKERKKPGLKKARRAPQWSKR